MATNQIANLGVKVDPRGAVRGSSKAKRAILGIGKSASRVKQQIFSLNGALGALGAGAVLKSIIKSASGLESLRVRLKFLTGSVDDASVAFDQMTAFASKVPFALEDIQQASPLLLTVVDDVDELNSLLEMTGDIAAVSGLDFVKTAEQLQRAMASGIASADLFRERGVASFLGFEAGVSVSAEETKKRMNEMWKNGTTTAVGATKELASTFQGQVSMMQDAWFKLKIQIADAGVFEFAKEAIEDLTKFLGDPQTLENAKKFGVVLTDIFSAIKSTGEYLLGLPKWVLEVGIVIAFLGGKKARLAIIGISAIAMGIDAVTKAIQDFQNQTEEEKLEGQLEGLEKRAENVSNKYKLALKAFNEFKTLHNLVNPDDIVNLANQRGGTALVEEFARLEQAVRRYKEELPKIETRIKETEGALSIQADTVRNLKDEYKALMGLHMEEHVFGTEQILSLEFYNEQLDKMMKGYKDVGIQATTLGSNLNVVNDHMNRNSMLAHNMAINLQKIADEAELAKEKTKEFADSMATNIEDSIMRMTQGLMSFKDVVKSVFQFVAMEMVKANIAKPLAGALTGILTGDTSRGGAGDGGVLGKMFPNLKLFANGGNPPVGKASIVGERGPELFVPNTAGTIVPNNKMGGQTINVTYAPQVNALDPATAQVVISENAPTIIGVIRQAFNENGTEVAI